MRRAALALLAGFAAIGYASAQDRPNPAKNGVIKPHSNVDPGMKVMPPKTPTTMPVVRPPGTARHDRHKRVIVVPK